MVSNKVGLMRIPPPIYRFLKRLGPYQSLFFLAIPLAIAEPLKLVALFVVGEGHFITGVLVMICAYTGSLFITERLFVVLKPKLLELPWFALAWGWFVSVRDKLVNWLRQTWTPARRHARRGNSEADFGVGWQHPNRARYELVGTKALQVNHRRSNMPDTQVNVTQLNRGQSTTAPLRLLELMRDLEVLGGELRIAEQMMGLPVWGYQDPLAERLRRVGVSDQRIEDFSAWRRTISSLTSDDSRNENQLAKIIAAEAVGATLLAELVVSLKKGNDRNREVSEPIAA
jgi:hypothetical protein